MELNLKILGSEILSPEDWINNVNTCGLFVGKEEEVIQNRVNICLEALKKEWTTKLQERNLAIPDDDLEFAELVFAQPDYQSQAQKQAKTPEQLLQEAKEQKIRQLEVVYTNAQLIKIVNGNTFYVPLKGEFYNTHITQKLTVAQSRGYATLVAQDTTGALIKKEDIAYSFWKKFIEIADPISISNFDLKEKYLNEIKTATQEELNAITFSFPSIKEVEMDLPDINDPLELAKNRKKIEIKALRDNQLELPTPQHQDLNLYTGNLANRSFNVSCKEHIPRFSAIINMLERQISELNPNPTREWTDASGTILNLTISDFQSLLDHLEARDKTEFRLCNLRKAAVDALTTIEEVEAFDITQIIV
jgi:hypothetical protein